MSSRLPKFVALALGLVIAFGLGRCSQWFVPASTHRAMPAHASAAHATALPRIAPPASSSKADAAAALDVSRDQPDYTNDIPAIASYEDLLYAQGDLLDDALSRLRPRTPGRANLYALAFAGDGEEAVFRNEADYSARLFAARFGADGHVLELVNSPRTLQDEPLATRTNLYAALDGIAAKMDRDQDILLLFLTSHGSRDHQLYVQLGALPLDQIAPDDLRHALDEAKIRWRVVVVSACYSGGFIPALREPHTLVITAARADRASFGCGSDSKITWFGKAFLVDALNETTDFRDAFERARTLIAGWENRDHEEPSDPQIWEGGQIEARLAAWRATLPPAPPVPFAPAGVANSPQRHSAN